MKKDVIPERWLNRLSEHLQEESKHDRDQLSASDFRYNLKIDFGDGSMVFFRFAFYLIEHDWNEVAVFTEHCGYHIFPLFDTKLELLESKWTDVGT